MIIYLPVLYLPFTYLLISYSVAFSYFYELWSGWAKKYKIISKIYRKNVYIYIVKNKYITLFYNNDKVYKNILEKLPFRSVFLKLEILRFSNEGILIHRWF